MSVLESHVLKDVNQFSPVGEDSVRVVKFGKDGEELVTFEPIDYKSIRDSHGTVDLWSLNSLIKAGVNPDFNIHTGFNSRIEGVDVVNQFESEIDSIIASDVDTVKDTVK